MDRSTWPRVLCRSIGRQARARLPPALVRLARAVAFRGPSDDNANRDGNRRGARRLGSQRSLHFPGLVFLPNRLADKKFPSFGHRRKKFPRSWDPDSPGRDTWFPAAEEDRVFSCPFDPKCVATMSHAASVHKHSLGILEQLFNNSFRFAPVSDFGIDHIVISIIGADHAAGANCDGYSRI